jgi:hypothetical protein
MKLTLICLLFICVACNPAKKDSVVNGMDTGAGELVFEKSKWDIMEGNDYPFRDRMVNDVLYNDTIRSLDKVQILELLGKPDRVNENYLYYKIAQKKLGNWPLHTKTLVIKLTESDSIEWIKLHE